MAKILKKDAKKLLAKVPQEHAFWCCDGRILSNIRELQQALTSMTDETFTYHSNGEKTDFGSWVKDIIGDEKLAKDLGKSLGRTQAANSVSSRISFLDRTLAAKKR